MTDGVLRPREDECVIRALRENAHAMKALRERLVAEVLSPAADRMGGLAEELMRDHGLTEGEASTLLSSTIVAEALSFRTVAAGVAHSEGMQLKDIAAAWGFATASGVTRYASEIRDAAHAQLEANQSGRPVTLDAPAGWKLLPR